MTGSRLSWRIEPWIERFKGLLVRLGPGAYISLCWPWPRKKPWQRRTLTLRGPGGGVGDELMCLPVFEEIKKRNPACRITFATRHPDFFRSHPAIDEVRLGGPDSPGLRLVYHHAIPPPRPLMTLMAECVGIRARFSRIHPPPGLQPSDTIRRTVETLQRPMVAIQPLASSWTTNKQWPLESWRALVANLAGDFTVVEIGSETAFAGTDLPPRFHSLAGQTALSDLFFVISKAALFIGPTSGGMHMANAAQVRSLIIAGGYESPDGYQYPDTTAFYSPVECAPCWRRDCPYGLKCLMRVSPAMVIEEARRLLAGGAPRGTVTVT